MSDPSLVGVIMWLVVCQAPIMLELDLYLVAYIVTFMYKWRVSSSQEGSACM